MPYGEALARCVDEPAGADDAAAELHPRHGLGHRAGGEQDRLRRVIGLAADRDLAVAGKGADALDPFWKSLRASHAKIKAVATDMSPAYIQAVRKHLPRAVHVFDHFHVVKLFNDKLSELRRELYREATEQLHKDILKGTRWLLLKNPENLDADRNEHARLEQALRLNEPLAIAYYLKEDLRQIWSQPNKRTARRVLRDWLARARASGIRILIQFAATLVNGPSFKPPMISGNAVVLSCALYQSYE